MQLILLLNLIFVVCNYIVIFHTRWWDTLEENYYDLTGRDKPRCLLSVFLMAGYVVFMFLLLINLKNLALWLVIGLTLIYVALCAYLVLARSWLRKMEEKSKRRKVALFFLGSLAVTASICLGRLISRYYALGEEKVRGLILLILIVFTGCVWIWRKFSGKKE
ncbi:hypothetical protein [Prevotella sp. KH2C16]|uniref:hypothetical protein n=1 Tax=Prevotella sp. KH2C16 TaxID=1855325 RepID=UPI0008EF5899|nr:hypothetical protein [Prevotella sp. KH2C16]SFF86582.1 hypothetical protein SAMN05216383_101275 [Prevotella sp. KH2C16]